MTFIDRPGRIAFDFDGTLTSATHHSSHADINLAPLREALARGYSVAIMTCNDVQYVAGVLRRAGIAALADANMSRWVWDSVDGTVLVTNRKVWADIYPDDRGFHWQYGDDPEAIFTEAEARKERARVLT